MRVAGRCSVACIVLLACGDARVPFAPAWTSPERDAAATSDASPDGSTTEDASVAPSYRRRQAGDSGGAGAGGAGAADAGDSGSSSAADSGTDACASCVPVATFPAPVPATLTQPARTASQCTTLAAATGFYTPASLFAVGGDLYVFSVDSSEATPKLLVHKGTRDPLAFAAPKIVLYGARKADLVAHAGTLRLLAARQFYAVELTSTDGITFTQTQQVGPKEPTYNCAGYPPARYFRGDSPPALLGMGNDYNTGIFGCYTRIFVGGRVNDTWAEPTYVGRGDVAFAYQAGPRAVLLTTSGTAFVSTDAGASFGEVDGVGTGGAFTGTQLVIVRPGVAAGGITLAYSSDAGASWSRQEVVLADTPATLPLLAADGPNLGLAIATSSELVLSASTDGGATWSMPARVTGSSTNLQGLAISGDKLVTLTAHAGLSTLEVCVR